MSIYDITYNELLKIKNDKQRIELLSHYEKIIKTIINKMYKEVQTKSFEFTKDPADLTLREITEEIKNYLIQHGYTAESINDLIIKGNKHA